MLKRQRERRRASITSLIDVIFLLLLFFMLASTFKRYSEVEMAASTETAAAGAPTDKTIVRLLIEPEAVMMNEHRVQDVDLTTSLNKSRKGEALTVSIKVTPEVSTQRLVDILATLSRLPDISLHLIEAS